MARQQDVLKQFESLHRDLLEEREQLRKRLESLNQALGLSGSIGSPGGAGFGGGASFGVELGMREAIQKATANSPLGVREIVEAIQRIGFRFKSKNPYNSVGAYLYGKEGRKYFKKTDGKFSPLPGAQAKSGNGKPAHKLSTA